MTNRIAATSVVCLIMFVLCAGCNRDDASAGPPGPAVGSATPQGGVITVAPEHGRRPHMAGAMGSGAASSGTGK